MSKQKKLAHLKIGMEETKHSKVMTKPHGVYAKRNFAEADKKYLYPSDWNFVGRISSKGHSTRKNSAKAKAGKEKNRYGGKKFVK
ncbi:hypothetical protein M1446_04280 [Candidatus Dependentiae bacterium]|nr:hypothetical protein [Candidatus Dependentiae bacterium]